MRIEQLYQFIVPLMFLAIWALTSLFSREAQQIPPRSARPPGPNGPRPGTDSGRAQDWRNEALSRQVPQQPPPGPSPASPRPATRSALRPEDGIVILESETSQRRSQASSATRQQGVTRRPAAKARKPPLPARQVESTSHNTLGGSLASTMISTVEPSQGLTKLTLGPVSGPLHGTTHDLMTVSAAAVSRPVDRSSASAQELRELLKSPEKVLQMMLLKELLGPPVSLRGKSLRRW